MSTFENHWFSKPQVCRNTHSNVWGKLQEVMENKNKKSAQELTLSDLRWFINIKYQSEADFARKMGWSVSTASRLLNGNWIPSETRVIERLAAELGINVVKVTRLFAGMEFQNNG